MKPKYSRHSARFSRQTRALLLGGSLFVAFGGQAALAADFAQNVIFASPAVIDPVPVPTDNALNVTVTATNATPKATLEALQGFRVIQNFTAIPSPGAVQALGNNYILNATDSSSTPDLKLSYFVGPAAEDALAAAAANTVVVASNISFQSSLGSSIRIQGASYNSAVGLRIEAGSWDGNSFTSGGVKAMGFTVNGPFNRMLNDSATVTYYDSNDNVLSTQVITSAPVTNVAAYTGHEVTSGPLIKYATVSFKGDTVGTASLLTVDDIAIAPNPSAIPTPVKWRVGNGDWDTATTNWQPLGGGSPISYVEGADVTFDDTASGTSPISVNLVNERAPATISVNAAKDYILADDGGEIAGGGSLTKSGTGMLTLATDNTFAGSTTLTQGAIKLTRGGALQNSSVILNGGALVFDSASGSDFSLGSLAAGVAGPGYDLALQDNSGSPGPINLTIGTNGGSTTYAGVLSGPGTLIKDGAGALTLTNANSYLGDTVLQGTGLLKISNPAALGTTGQVLLNSTQLSPGIATFEITGGINFSRPLTIDSTSGRAHFAGTGGANTLSSPIDILNSGVNTISLDAAGGTGNLFTVSGNITATDFFGTFALRGNSGGLLSGVITAPIGATTPTSTLDLNQGAANVVWTISSTGNTWGITRMSMSANGTAPNELGYPGGKLVLGANNALCTTAKVLWPNTSNSIAGGTLDLAGFSQTIAGLDKPAAHPNDTPNSIPNITNSSASADSTLTLEALFANYAYTGKLSDGPTRKLNLTLNSPGRTQRLTRALAYTGNTLIVDGTLRVDVSTFADASTLTIGTTEGAAAVLNLPAAGTDTVGFLFIDGVAMENGKEYGNIDSVLPVIATDAITGLGTIRVVNPTASPYADWVTTFQPGFTLNQPDQDQDGDGLTNQEEFAFGLNPKSGASVSPIVGGLPANGQFSYTRLATSGLTYKVLTSTTLGSWTVDMAATNSQVPGPVGANNVQSVAVTLSAQPVNGKLFVRILAEE